MSMQQWTDAQILDHWQRTGEEAAFRLLHDRCRPKIIRRLRRRLPAGFTSCAGDVAQAVLLDLRDTRKKIASLDGWLVVVSEQRLEEFLRREHAQKRGIDRTCLLSVLLPDERGDNDGEGLHEFADHNTPDKLACQAEQRGTARRLVDQLTGRQREVMILVALKGQKVSVVAEALGLSRASVRDYLDKARAKLMQMHELRELAEVLPPSCRAQLPT